VPRDRADWFAIVEQIEAGDQAALLRLTALVASLLTRAGAYRSDPGQSDLVQEICIALVEAVRRQAIRERGAFVGYAWATVRNRWLKLLRTRERKDSRHSDRELADLGAEDLEPGAALGGIDPGTRVDLERALGALPAPERLAIEAIYLRGQSYEEAAAALELPLGTLKRRQNSGLKRLRQTLQADGRFA
jgi:RNA polymerase sigma-70 factor (ECF subfamily)